MENIKIASWNLNNISTKSKIKRFDAIATAIKRFDLICIQEIMSQDVLPKLCTFVKGYNWAFSNVGTTKRTEYVGFVFSSKIQCLGNKLIENHLYAQRVCVGFFRAGSYEFVVFNVHIPWYNGNTFMIRKKLNSFVRFFILTVKYDFYAKNIILLGDFNMKPSCSAFDELRKEGFFPVITDKTPTTLSGKTLDNIWIKKSNANYNGKWGILVWKRSVELGLGFEGLGFDTLGFGLGFGGLGFGGLGFDKTKEKYEISDHFPIWAQFNTNVKQSTALLFGILQIS